VTAARPSILLMILALAACASGDLAASDAGPPGPEVDACVAAAEACNGVDDDCDQSIDEDFALGADCTVGTGACQAAGRTVCDDTGAATVCDATSGTPAGELCNGVDDDCDQAIDEGLAVGTACDGDDADACAEGVVVCSGDAAVCDDATAAAVETCNGVDDDCRDGIDDPWPVGQACTVGVGACARAGSYLCSGPDAAACDAAPGTATAELCGDGVDQDCNGADVGCPINDAAAGAVDVSAGGTFTVDLGAAHDDHGDATAGCGAAGGRDVYYRLTLAADEVVYLDTFGSSFDSVLRVYAGACTALGARQACFDDACSSVQSQGAVALAAGAYCIVADQASSAQTTGALVLRVTRGGRTGAALGATSGTVTGNTCGGADAWDGNCQSSTAPENGYYFTVCPSTTRTLSANTCTGTTWDSVIYLRAAGSASDAACSDDAIGCGSGGLQSSFSAASAAGPGLFWLVVDGYAASCGAYTLTYGP